ncbi:uncharacterized protein LOC132759348 isoform X2 [Ruditapes philippinarum]|uniref:uncharacterized protein LOC132759348 isoform X2 n=1 Tax=Ruditapes philippinarum TaxID=129788 RepID=UPI00295AFBDB|nr:uncharacterized protein LOC132759348 isoform X2 [Ruditapes philippinarum]
MLHAPLSQIMNTSLNQWQTTRFSVFTRPSRVEVNTQKDLEDMLSKLDETPVRPDDVQTEQRKMYANRKKFLELALPCAILAILSLVYSLIYLVDAGQGMVTGIQTRNYLTGLGTLDNCMAVLLHEHNKRISLPEKKSDRLSSDYHRTDEKLHEVLDTNTLVEWKLISQITDWRSKDIHEVVAESEFYMHFASDLSAVIFQRGFELDEVRKWKSLYKYMSSFKKAFQVKILRNILILLETRSQRFKIDTNAEKTLNFVSKFKNVLCETDEDSGSACSYSCTYDLFCYLHSHSMNFSMNETCWNSTVKYETSSLKHLSAVIRGKQIKLMEDILSSCKKTIAISAILFCLLLIFIGTTAACVSIFIFIFREQIQIAVVVSDILKGVTSRVDKQRESTDQVVTRIIPRTLVRKVNVDNHSNMIPYEAPDTTIFMVSIAGYTKFFSMFTAPQTIHILTLVMELLDERMEQYNVFPVARMGQYLLVLSDSEVKKQVRNACEIANLAIDIMTCCSDLEIGRHSQSKLQMKLAIHTGPCYGRLVVHNGTVQLKIVGTTLTVLRQIHKAAIPNMIQVSETTQKLLAACDCYSLHYRGNLKIPDMSKYYKIYWLNGRRVSSALSMEDCCSRMGSWIELERKPLYRLDENDGTYEPLNKTTCRRYSQMSVGSYYPTVCFNNSSYVGDSDGSPI